MSPNQIHEVKTDAITNKRSCCLYTLKAYKMLLKVELSSNKSGYTTRSGNSALHRILELQDKNNLESLFIVTNGKSGNLWKLYQELSLLAS